MRRPLEFSSRKKNLEGIKEEPQKSYEEHMRDLRALLDSLPKEVDEEIDAAIKETYNSDRRDQDIAAAREAVMSTFRKSSPEVSHRNNPLDMPKDLEGVSAKRLFKSNANIPKESDSEPKSKFPMPSNLFGPISPEPESEFPMPSDSFEPISSEPESFQMPEPFQAPDFFVSEPIQPNPDPDFEPLTVEELPSQTLPEPEPTPEPTPKPESISEPIPEQLQFKPESGEIIKFESSKALNALKQIHANLVSATPDQVQRFNALYGELSTIWNTIPNNKEEEHQKMINLFDARDKINQLHSELIK